MRGRVAVRAPSPRYPFGLAALGVCAWAFAAAMAYVLLAARAPRFTPGELMVVRAFAAVLAALGVVAGEALIRVRPWAWRASRALALAYAGALAAFAAADGDVGRAVATFVGFALPSGVFLLPALLFIHDVHLDRFAPGQRGAP